MSAELLVGHQSDHQFVVVVSASEYQTFTRYSQRESHARLPHRLTVFISLQRPFLFNIVHLFVKLQLTIFAESIDCLHLKSRSKSHY